MASKHYVNNKRMYEELVERKAKVDEALAQGKQKPRVSNYLGECFLSMTKKIANRPEFRGYSYRDEMECDAIDNCIKYIDSFDVSKSQIPFAYFTRTIMNAYWHRIAFENKQRYIKYKYLDHNVLNDLIVEVGMEGGHSPIYEDINTYLNDEDRAAFVARYETKLKLKKEKKVVESTSNTIADFLDNGD